MEAFDPRSAYRGCRTGCYPQPGSHSGHLSLFRRTDGVLITGDAALTVDLNSLLESSPAGQECSALPLQHLGHGGGTAFHRRPGGPRAEGAGTGHGPVKAEGAAQALEALARGQDVPARWRQGLFTGVDYSARGRYRPTTLYQRVQKRLGPFLVGLGIGPKQVVVLEVPGRRSGLIRRNALVKASYDGSEYLVALAGESEWARNVRAAHGQVVIGLGGKPRGWRKSRRPGARDTEGLPLGTQAELTRRP